MHLSNVQTFLQQQTLYQLITTDTTIVDTYLTFDGEWDVVITTDHATHKFTTPMYSIEEDQLFQYSTLIDYTTIQYIIDQHHALENTLCQYKTTP